MERMAALREAVAALDVAVVRKGERLLIDVHNRADQNLDAVNVHHAERPNGGFPFLASVLGVSVAAGETVRVELAACGRRGPYHIVFQRGDAFEGRALG